MKYRGENFKGKNRIMPSKKINFIICFLKKTDRKSVV